MLVYQRVLYLLSVCSGGCLFFHCWTLRSSMLVEILVPAQDTWNLWDTTTYSPRTKQIPQMDSTSYLVGGLEHCLFFHMLGIITPTDSFFRGVETPNQLCFTMLPFWLSPRASPRTLHCWHSDDSNRVTWMTDGGHLKWYLGEPSGWGWQC